MQIEGIDPEVLESLEPLLTISKPPQPELQMDGTYELIVRARDVSGNYSGQYDFQVQFEVITKRMISNVLNYPNPFSTSTRFTYTLTGDEPPQDFRIQIMTISGVVVKELTSLELGDLKIGTHQTEYTWDGTDEYGDKLANGVYLYRLEVGSFAETKRMVLMK